MRATLRLFAATAHGHRLAPWSGRPTACCSCSAAATGSSRRPTTRRAAGWNAERLPFRDQLTEHLARIQLPRALDERAALAALAGGKGQAPERVQVRDVAGDPVAIVSSTPVTVLERTAGQARVTGFATDRHPNEKAWRPP